MAETIPEAVKRAADRYGEATAVAEPGRAPLNYCELLAQTRRAARAFIAGGVEPGNRVAIWSPNTHHWVVGALGALYAGATLVPVNTRFTGPEAMDVIGRSNAKALLVAGPFLGADRLALLGAAAYETGAGLPELVVQIAVEATGPDSATEPCGRAKDWAGFLALADDVSDDDADAIARAVTPEHVSDILFTSGTTGRSKGAMSAHRQALDVARAWSECAELTSDDRYLIVNPFFHSFGYKAGILACLLTGAAIVPQLVFDPCQAMRLIETERITVLPGAPTIYSSILDHPRREDYDLSSLRLAVTGAAVVPVALVERMRAELGFDVVLTAYGLTEAVVATMCRPGDDPQRVAHTSGRATAGFEVAIAGTDGAVGAPGEVLLRGPNVMLGYLDDPDATSEAVDSAEWLHTGDIGRLDERGYLTITDRLKDMYICGGFNVYPAEVEQALARHPAVSESAVIGVPDGRLGEVGQAFIVLRPGSEHVTAEELIEYCRGRLANYKVPRQVKFRDALPRNPAGKTLKRLLRQEDR